MPYTVLCDQNSQEYELTQVELIAANVKLPSTFRPLGHGRNIYTQDFVVVVDEEHQRGYRLRARTTEGLPE